MNKLQIVTLLTDFGHQDVYVGVLKGVMLQINPYLNLVDLCHGIFPQDVASASFQLGNAYRYFPDGTVHLAVVDPGVGSQRRGVAIQIASGYLVGPDNGLFSHVLAQTPALAAVALTHPEFWRTPNPSSTFHGRDIFAPIAAHLTSGTVLTALGDPLEPDELVTLPSLPCVPVPGGWQGFVQAIDTYGNLITNLPGELVTTLSWQVELAGQSLVGQNAYNDAMPGQALALLGSHGWVEIAINHGNAQQSLRLGVGAPLWLQLKQP